MDTSKEVEKQNGAVSASSRVLGKLQVAMESGNYYEAHQMYRTLYFRYLSQPKKREELIQLLFDGSTKLLDRGQITSGCDLALLLTEVLQKTSKPIEEKILDKVESIFERLIRASKRYGAEEDDEGEIKNAIDASNDRDNFVGNLIKWTQIVAPKFKYGHPILHSRLAGTWWRMKNYEQARYHFLLSNDGEGCASFLIEYHVTKGYGNEVDLFVAQAVLQFLCHKDKTTATTVFYQYVQFHPRILAGRNATSTATVPKNFSSSIESDPPYALPLLNFIWLLLLCIDTGRVTDYTLLIEQYQPSIKRDPSYNDYLDRIGQLFFGLPPPQKKQGGMGGAFLKNLMAGLLGEEEQGEDGPSSADEAFESVPGTPTPDMIHAAARQEKPKAKFETDDALD